VPLEKKVQYDVPYGRLGMQLRNHCAVPNVKPMEARRKKSHLQAHISIIELRRVDQTWVNRQNKPVRPHRLNAAHQKQRDGQRARPRSTLLDRRQGAARSKPWRDPPCFVPGCEAASRVAGPPNVQLAGAVQRGKRAMRPERGKAELHVK
jgi:hypothetical protein